MKETFRNSMTTIYENERGDLAAISRDESHKAYYHVIVRRADESKGKTIKTRCTHEKAYAIVKEWLES